MGCYFSRYVAIALLVAANCCAALAAPADRVAQLKQRIHQIEQLCVPRKGTPRQDVESVFGPGRPLAKAPSKVLPKEPPPTDSPRRGYQICTNGTLIIWYDSEWNVSLASYINPYSLKGRPLGWPDRSDEELIRELEPRLKQLETILKIYNKKQEG